MDSLLVLRALNDADRWIEKVGAQRDHLPELEELSALEASLRALLTELNEAQRAVEPVRQSYLSAQESARKLAIRARDLESALSSSTGSGRELSSLQHELEQVRERVAAAEDEELNFLMALEPLDEAVANVKLHAQPMVARRAELRATATQLQSTLDEEIASLRVSRAELAQSLDAEWRHRYEAALARVGHSGAAYVDQGRCDGCRIALSPLDLDRFSHLEGDVVMDCPECGRLLLP